MIATVKGKRSPQFSGDASLSGTLGKVQAWNSPQRKALQPSIPVPSALKTHTGHEARNRDRMPASVQPGSLEYRLCQMDEESLVTMAVRLIRDISTRGTKLAKKRERAERLTESKLIGSP